MKISSYVFPLITTPYITRTLGAVANGKISFATSVVSYFSMFAQLGIPSYGIRECAICRDDKEELTKTVQELLIINSVSAVISYAALIIAMLLVPKFREEPTLLIIQSIAIILNTLGMEWLYQAIEQYQYITVRNIAFKIITIVLMFILVHHPEDYIIYSCLTVASSSGSYILNLWNSRRFLVHRTFKGRYNFRRHLKPIFIFFSLSVAVSIYTSLDTVMLGFLSNDKEVAYYSLGTRIRNILATTVSALGPVLLPRISYCLVNGEEDKFKAYIQKSLHFVLLISIPFTVYFTLTAGEVVRILGGSEYAPARACMQVINFTIIPLGLGNIAGSQILTPKGNERYIMYAAIIGAGVDFLFNLIFIQYFGAVGAAAATVLTELVVAIIQLTYAWGDIKEAFKYIPYRSLVFSNLISAVVLIFVLRLLSGVNSLVSVLVTAVIYFTIYMFSLFIQKDELVLQYTILVVKKLIGRFDNEK